jgi:hypothetical protein
MSTTVIESIDSIIANYDLNTRTSTTEAFVHTFSYSSGLPIKSLNTIIPGLTYSGAKFTSIPNILQASAGASYPYATNYEDGKILSKPIGISSAVSIQGKYSLTKLDSLGEKNAISYDLFETLNPSYQAQSIDFGIVIGTYEIYVSFLRGPSNQKITSPAIFVEQTEYLNPFWNKGTADINDVCPSNLIANDMIATIRIKKDGVFIDTVGKEIVDYSTLNTLYQLRTIASGSFKALNLTRLGTDGRNTSLSYLKTIPFKQNIDLKTTSDVVYNDVYYPLKTDNTTFPADNVSTGNPLDIAMNIRYNNSKTTLGVIFTVTLNGSMIATSDEITVQSVDLSTLSFFQRNISKNSKSDYEISNIQFEYAGDNELDGKLQDLTGQYAPPAMYFSSATTSIQTTVNNPNFDTIYYTNGNKLTVSFAAFGGDAVVNYSINGAAYVTGTSNVITLAEGTYEIIAYTSGVNYADSNYVKKTFKVYRLVAAPVISSAISGTCNVTITCADAVDIFYTIGGDDPDTVNFANCVRYTGVFTVRSYSVIKAVAVSSLNSKSQVTTAFIDPVFGSTVSTPTITTAESANGAGEYTGTVTATISGDVGTEIRYTLDGSDPADFGNRHAKKYIKPFPIRAFNGNTTLIRAVSLSTTKNKAEGTKTLTFTEPCSSWRLLKKYGLRSAALTTTGQLKLYAGSAITRDDELGNESYITFNLLGVGETPSLNVTYENSLNDFNFYGNTSGSVGSNLFYPSLNVLDVVNGKAVMSLGSRNNNQNLNNFNEYGQFTWDTSVPLKIRLDFMNAIELPASSLKLNPQLDFDTNHVANAGAFGGGETYPNGYLEYKIPTVYTYSNYIVENVLNGSTNAIELPSPADLTIGQKIKISRSGGDPSGVLLVVSTYGKCFLRTTTSASVSIGEYESYEFTVVDNLGSNAWQYAEVENYSIYNGYKAIKMSVFNGTKEYSTPYLVASSRASDRLVIEVSSTEGLTSADNTYLILGDISGKSL